MKHNLNLSISQNAAFADHEEVVFCDDPNTGLRAIIAVHDTTLGPALGGTRMWPYESDAAALRDVLRLSYGMTLKNALAGVLYGGGKAVIIGDPKRDKTPELLTSFAHYLNRFGGRFITGEDVGMRVADADIIARVTPHIRGTSSGHAGDPSPFTAYGVYCGLLAAAEHKYCSLGIEGMSVSVQGLGAVGMALCQYLHDAGAELFVSDIRIEAVREAQDRFGACPVSPEDSHRVAADIYAPCALGGGLNAQTIPDLTARVVAGSANNQLRSAHDGDLLQRSGILYAPDYVINAGGVISIAHDKHGYDPARLRAHVAGIGDTLREIFVRSEKTGRPTSRIADELALARIAPPHDRHFAA